MTDVEYFTSYEDLEIHELMLLDTPRQDAYRDAILKNKNLFKGKTVLDVGCGSGILSIFCAQAGAKKVFAVEASNLVNIAREVVKENGFESVIEVFQSKIEDFELPEGIEEVDILVSEWMGFYLLHEGMLDSVLGARDKFLKDGGLLFPESATIYLAPCSVPGRFDKWENLSGVKMTSFAKHIRQQKSQKPEITHLEPDSLLSEGSVVAFVDLKEVSLDELNDFTIKEVIVTQKPGKFQGVCIWFDVTFPRDDDNDKDTSVTLSTGPLHPVTHWKQSIIVLPDTACEEVEKGEPIALHLVLKRSEQYSRRYNMTLSILDPEIEEHGLPCDCIMTKCILTKAHLMSMDVDD